MVDACRRAGIGIRIVRVTSTGQTRARLARLRPRVVVIDSIAIAFAAPLSGWMRAELGARVVALMHMPTETRGTRELLRSSDRVIAVSNELARDLAKQGARRSRLTVISPGSDAIPHGPRRSRTKGETVRVL